MHLKHFDQETNEFLWEQQDRRGQVVGLSSKCCGWLAAGLGAFLLTTGVQSQGMFIALMVLVGFALYMGSLGARPWLLTAALYREQRRLDVVSVETIGRAAWRPLRWMLNLIVGAVVGGLFAISLGETLSGREGGSMIRLLVVVVIVLGVGSWAVRLPFVFNRAIRANEGFAARHRVPVRSIGELAHEAFHLVAAVVLAELLLGSLLLG